jgi:hypothetical protein
MKEKKKKNKELRVWQFSPGLLLRGKLWQLEVI